MLFDVHCHLNFPQFERDRERIIDSCLREGIYLLNVGCDYLTSRKAVEIAKRYQEGVFASVGIHPQEAEKEEFSQEKFLALAGEKRVVAIGEIGLDYCCSASKEKQKVLLEKQIDFAVSLGKPLIFHCRSDKGDSSWQAHRDLLKILEKKKIKKAEIHCFDCRDLSILEEFLNKGFYIGLTGLINYVKGLEKVVLKIPLSQLLVETDSPFLHPLRKRERNTPLNVKLVAQRVAYLKKIDFEEVCRATFENSQKFLFGD